MIIKSISYINKLFVDKHYTYQILDEVHTIQDMIYFTIKYFSNANIWYGHGTTNAVDEAIYLVLSSLRLPLNVNQEIYTAIPISYEEKKYIFKHIIRRIKERIPVAYLTNTSWFCGYKFYVNEHVLVPRSPISELISNRFSSLINYQPCRILDMCTGSGCIAISCAYNFPIAKIDAVDISMDALIVARYNIKKHNLLHQINLIHSDLFHNVPKVQYDLIITNPPYVSDKDISHLPTEYHHEPKLGLSSGNNGLKIIQRILAYALDYLSYNGILICEVGNNMVNLIKKYPHVPFIWLEFANGGTGVFMLTSLHLTDASKYFTIYKNT